MQFPVIAIAGRKFAGKDTAAAALVNAGYVNVKFATPLKDMLKALLAARGVPAEQAETYIDGELKETPCEFLDFSDSTAAQRHKLAVSMLCVLLTYQGVSEYDAGVMLEGAKKDTPTKFLQFRNPAYALETLASSWLGKLMSTGQATPRYAMQTLGTEWGRVLIGDRIWIDAALNRIDDIVKAGGKAAVSDMRFDNEADAMDEISALKLRVTRQVVGAGNEFSNHPSETAIDGLRVHLDIANDETIEVLHGRVLLAAQNIKTVRKVEIISKVELIRFPTIAENPKLRGVLTMLRQTPRDDRDAVEVEFLANVPIIEEAA